MASKAYTPEWLTKRLLIMGFHMETSVFPVVIPAEVTAEAFLGPALFQSTTARPPSLELLFQGEGDPTMEYDDHKVRIWLETLKPYFFNPRDEASWDLPREDQPCDWLVIGSVVGTDLATPQQPVPARVYLTTRHDGKLDAGYAQFQIVNLAATPAFDHLLADLEEMVQWSQCDPLERIRRPPTQTPNP